MKNIIKQILLQHNSALKLKQLFYWLITLLINVGEGIIIIIPNIISKVSIYPSLLIYSGLFVCSVPSCTLTTRMNRRTRWMCTATTMAAPATSPLLCRRMFSNKCSPCKIPCCCMVLILTSWPNPFRWLTFSNALINNLFIWSSL